MTILNFSYAKIKDADAFQEYIAKAAVIMKDFNVEVVVRGDFAQATRGAEPDTQIAAVFRYPDMATAEAFYASPAYRDIVALRDRACDMTIHFYTE